MKYTIFILAVLTLSQDSIVRFPIRQNQLVLTQIGEFGIERKARPGIPAHLHTGIDILPPNKNYASEEPIYPISNGVVISKRTDGPYGQLIIEHDQKDVVYWSVYEHITGIEVELFQPVNVNEPIARFFKADELDIIGWQFNHFHLEILKKQPVKIQPDQDNPERLFNSYTLSCYTNKSLMQHFYHPSEFLMRNTSN